MLRLQCNQILAVGLASVLECQLYSEAGEDIEVQVDISYGLHSL